MKGFAQSTLKLLTIVGIATSSVASHAQVQRIMNRWAAEHAYEKMGTTIVQSSPDDIITHCLPTDRVGDTETCRKEKYDPATQKFVAIGDWYQREDGEIPPAERKTEPGSAGKTTSKVSGFLEGGVPATPEARYRDSMQGAETALMIEDTINSVVDYAKVRLGINSRSSDNNSSVINAAPEPGYATIAAETRQAIDKSNAGAASQTMQAMTQRASQPPPVPASNQAVSNTGAATSGLAVANSPAKPRTCLQYGRVFNDIAGPSHGWQTSCTSWSN